jgi:hypothetical protein
MSTRSPVYRARQIAVIRDAVAAGRDALRASDDPSPLLFARAFIAAGGVQIPGQPDADDARDALAERLLRALATDQRRVAGDRDLQRELDRAHAETAWVRAQADDLVVGFRLELPPAAMEGPTAEALSHDNHGLGPGIVRKADIVVLQPDCDGARFYPVTEHEIEC